MLDLQNVRLEFTHAGSASVVLDELSLSVAEGEFVSLVGPSGCGKTSLLRIIAGFQSPSAGKVTLDGNPITGPGADRVVVFQQAGLYPWKSVRKNVAFGPSLRTRTPDWNAVDTMLELVGLADFAKAAPYRLSGGQQQRVALARALVMRPRILLMDEPFGALDAFTRQRMQELLLELRQQLNLTVIFITHDVEEAVLLGDRVITMGANPGRCILEQRIDLPFPRSKATTLTPAFQDYRRTALEALGRVTLEALNPAFADLTTLSLSDLERA